MISVLSEMLGVLMRGIKEFPLEAPKSSANLLMLSKILYGERPCSSSVCTARFT